MMNFVEILGIYAKSIKIEGKFYEKAYYSSGR